MRAKDAVGRYGEQVAATYLAEQGLTVLERNWRCAVGEIDIVARDGSDVVVCEVKTRSSLTFGCPAEAVSDAKLRRLWVLGWRWCAEHEMYAPALRVDVLCVLRSPRGAATVEHLRGVC